MRDPLRVLLATTVSDSHTWNLVYLGLHLTGLGHEVTGLGPCTPVPLLLSTGADLLPDLVVISSVNGHGVRDGVRLARMMRAAPRLARTPAVIGGKLGIGGRLDPAQVRDLLLAGFDDVFDDGDLDRFTAYVAALGQAAGNRDAS